MKQNFNRTQSRKGFAAPILLAIIALLAIGGGYAIVKTNPGLAQKLGFEKQIKKDEAVKGLSFDFYHEPARCENYVRITNSDGKPAQFQTSAPRDNKSSVEGGYDIGLRNKFGTGGDIYEYNVAIEQPDATVATANGRVVGDNFGTTNFPKSFVGPKAIEGVYKVIFKIENRVVACDEFKIVASGKERTQSAVFSDWKTYNGKLYTFLYPKDWTVWEANRQLGLTIIYPNSRSKEAMNKTISTTDEITVATVNGQLDTTGTQKITLRGQAWYVKSYGRKIDGGTENGLSYYTATAENKYIEVTSGVSNKNFVEAVVASLKFISPITTATTDWKTYRDAHINVAYEFKGPAALKTGKVGEGGGVVYDTEDHTYLFIVFCGYPNPDRTLAELRKEPEIAYIDNYPARVSEGVLTNTVGYSYQYLSKVFFTPQNTCDISMFLKNNYDREILKPVFDAVLSTLKFMK